MKTVSLAFIDGEPLLDEGGRLKMYDQNTAAIEDLKDALDEHVKSAIKDMTRWKEVHECIGQITANLNAWKYTVVYDRAWPNLSRVILDTAIDEAAADEDVDRIVADLIQDFFDTFAKELGADIGRAINKQGVGGSNMSWKSNTI